MSGDAAAGDEPRTAVVLDSLPHGRPDDDRPAYQKSPLAQAVVVDTFRLVELELDDDAVVGIDDAVPIDPPADFVTSTRPMGFDDLSSGARAELEHVVMDRIEADEARFVEFFNEAGAITLRLHQFNLLPGIGDKLRDAILDERKREPFSSLDELADRVSGLHDPRETLHERVMAELRDDDVKYKLFVRDPEQ